MAQDQTHDAGISERSREQVQRTFDTEVGEPDYAGRAAEIAGVPEGSRGALEEIGDYARRIVSCSCGGQRSVLGAH